MKTAKLTPKQIELVQDVLCNDEISSDQELTQYLVTHVGLAEDAAGTLVARRSDFLCDLTGKLSVERVFQDAAMEYLVRLTLRNGLLSKSGLTLVDTDVIRELVRRLGYSERELKALDIANPAVNPFAKIGARS